MAQKISGGAWLVALIILLAVQVVQALRKIDSRDLEGNSRYPVRKRSSETESITSHLNLGQNVGLKEVDFFGTAQGNTKRRFRETYNGRKVYNTALDVEQEGGESGDIVDAEVYTGFEDDLAEAERCELGNDEAEGITLAHFGIDKIKVEETIFEEWVYVDESKTAHYATRVDLFIITVGEKTSRPHAFVDKCRKNILDSFDRAGFVLNARQLEDTFVDIDPQEFRVSVRDVPSSRKSRSSDCDIKIKGGNPKRPIKYGTPGYCLELTRSADGRTCFLENQYVIGVDLENSDDLKKRSVANFTCVLMYEDQVNGGLSPMLDAFFYATKTLEMFREWYGFEALSKPKPYVLTHRGVNLTEAAWDGASLVLGDGDGKRTYPWTTLDIVAHELAHGVGEKAANLEYRGQPGGIDEAFCDMTGVAAEKYLLGYSDWFVGADMMLKNQAVRRFNDPTKDGRSIKNIKDYKEDMDVHHSSGLYNFVFFQMAYVNRLGVRAAYECFLAANLLYWREKTDFEDGACGTIRGAYDSGYDMDIVADSFRKAGLTLVNCPDFTKFVTSELKSDHQHEGLRVSQLRQPLFRILVPADATKVTITGSQGVNVAISSSYKRSSTSVSSGKSSASAKVAPGTIVYVRFFKDQSSNSDEIKDVTVSLSFA